MYPMGNSDHESLPHLAIKREDSQECSPTRSSVRWGAGWRRPCWAPASRGSTSSSASSHPSTGSSGSKTSRYRFKDRFDRSIGDFYQSRMLRLGFQGVGKSCALMPIITAKLAGPIWCLSYFSFLRWLGTTRRRGGIVNGCAKSRLRGENRSPPPTGRSLRPRRRTGQARGAQQR